MLRWARYGYHKKRFRTHYVELLYFSSYAIYYDVLHSGASEVPTLRHYFSCSGGPSTDTTNSASRHITPNLCFCIQWNLRVTLCILVHPVHEMLTHYFSCSSGSGMNSTKRASGHITLNLCFFIPCDLLVT
jgi:hypothetical protein